ncbi:MAG: CreA family protein [Burkholderiaceae bacterium]|jgi:catabolite regulation protein CreA
MKSTALLKLMTRVLASGLAEDPSQFSLACRQIGPITIPE